MATQAPSKPRKKKAPARRAASASGARAALPDWGALRPVPPSRVAKRAGRAKAGAKKASKKAAQKVRRSRPLDVVPSLRFGLLTLLACLALTVYVSHVYATRATLAELQDARRENERLRLTHQRLQGDVDRMTGPAVVMRRAAALGLEEGIAYGPSIRLDD